MRDQFVGGIMKQTDSTDGRDPSFTEAWVRSYLRFGNELTPLQRARLRKRFREELQRKSEARKMLRDAGIDLEE